MRCLPLGLITTLRTHAGSFVEPPLLATVEADSGVIAAVVMRTPPHNLVLARPREAAALEAEKQARQREELNVLYVAMTRARSELAISSVTPRAASFSTITSRTAAFVSTSTPRAAGASSSPTPPTCSPTMWPTWRWACCCRPATSCPSPPCCLPDAISGPAGHWPNFSPTSRP